LLRQGKKGLFYGCSTYPECRHIESADGEKQSGGATQDLPETKGECPRCGEGELQLRQSKKGPFYGCSAYPSCKFTQPVAPEGVPENLGECPVCGNGELVLKQGRDNLFYSCTTYPACKHTAKVPDKDVEIPAGMAETSGGCPECAGTLVLRTGKHGFFYGCSAYPTCNVVRPAVPDVPQTAGKCPECHTGTMELRRGKGGVFYSCSTYPTCKATQEVA